MTTYQEFLSSKRHSVSSCGKEISRDLVHNMLFDWQKDITLWAIKKGRCAIFLDTGLGKTFIQLQWAKFLNKLS